MSERVWTRQIQDSFRRAEGQPGKKVKGECLGGWLKEADGDERKTVRVVVDRCRGHKSVFYAPVRRELDGGGRGRIGRVIS